MTPRTVVYVADADQANRLLMSVASGARFFSVPVRIIDIGLPSALKEQLKRLQEDVDFISPVDSLELPDSFPRARRYQALYQKTWVGRLVHANRMVFLDSDIVITSPEFEGIFARICEGSVCVSPSAWDRDLHWKYSPASLPMLRAHVGIADLSLDDAVYNSGVWGMTGETAASVSEVWTADYRRAVLDEALHRSLNPRAMIGDQEYLGISARKLGVRIVLLHGSYNMQVHENRMPWGMVQDGSVGGHLGEPMEPVKAVHYNNGRDVSVAPKQIASPAIRDWIRAQYASVLDFLESRGVTIQVKLE